MVSVKPADCHTTRGGGVDACLIHSRSYHFFGKLNEHSTRLVIENETQEKKLGDESKFWCNSGPTFSLEVSEAEGQLL